MGTRFYLRYTFGTLPTDEQLQRSEDLDGLLSRNAAKLTNLFAESVGRRGEHSDFNCHWYEARIIGPVLRLEVQHKLTPVGTKLLNPGVAPEAWTQLCEQFVMCMDYDNIDPEHTRILIFVAGELVFDSDTATEDFNGRNEAERVFLDRMRGAHRVHNDLYAAVQCR